MATDIDSWSKVIFHIDMNAFFASMRRKPQSGCQNFQQKVDAWSELHPLYQQKDRHKADLDHKKW